MLKATILAYSNNLINGVIARVPGAGGKKYFCAPTTKTAEFEVRYTKGTKARKKHLLCVISVIFRSIMVRSSLETYSTKAAAVGESRLTMQGPGPNRSSRTEPPTLRRFYSVFPKKKKKNAFLGIF